MKTNKIKMILMAVFAILLATAVDVSAQKKTDCTTPDDEAIVKAIYAKISKKYDDQVIHINVRSKNGEVTIEGWATTKKILKDIGKMAKKVSCVKKVENKLTEGISGGCGPGLKKCGAICIPQEDVCNICTVRTCN
jgi:osmotically-inducible protein OsmY